MDRNEFYIGNVPYKYKKVDKLWSGKIKECIIHMYPKEDTLNGNGELCGYCDSLFFDMVIYNEDTMEYYVLNNRDALNINVKTETRIFKDLSTMIICREPAMFNVHQDVTISKFI